MRSTIEFNGMGEMKKLLITLLDRRITMDKIIKQKWVEALRSGKYQQTQCSLHDLKIDKYCCLGVLCDLVTPQDKRGVTSSNKEVFYNATGFIPQEIRSEYGIDAKGMISDLRDKEGYPISLLYLNDIDNLTFDQIADVIEFFF